MNQFFVKAGFPVLVALVLSVLIFSGCLYSKVRYPIDQDVAQTQLGGKTGTASAHSIAWLVAWGDAGTARAAENGGLLTINHLDGEYLMVLFGLYARHTTIAYGD